MNNREGEYMNQLGIDPFLIGVQIVNFSLLVFILKKFLYKPLIKGIKAREEKLEKIERDKQAVEKKLAETEEENAKILKKAAAEAQILKKEMLEVAKAEEKEIIAKANKQAQQIVISAKESLETEKRVFEREMTNRSLRLATAISQKALQDLLTENLKKESVEKAILKFKSLKN